MGNITTSEGLAPYVKRYGSDPEYASFIDAKRTDIEEGDRKGFVETSFTAALANYSDDSKRDAMIAAFKRIKGGMPPDVAMAATLTDPESVFELAQAQQQETADEDAALEALKNTVMLSVHDPDTPQENSDALLQELADAYRGLGRPGPALIYERLKGIIAPKRGDPGRYEDIFGSIADAKRLAEGKTILTSEELLEIKIATDLQVSLIDPNSDPEAALREVAQKIQKTLPTRRPNALSSLNYPQAINKRILEMVTALDAEEAAAQAAVVVPAVKPHGGPAQVSRRRPPMPSATGAPTGHFSRKQTPALPFL
jgi:hypothetical protein